MDADNGKEFSDAIMGAMQSLRENLSEAFPAAVRICSSLSMRRLAGNRNKSYESI